MSRRFKWITGTVAAIFCLALLILAGAWRLGLLPLLFPPPAPGWPTHTSTESANPPTESGAGAGVGNAQTQPSTGQYSGSTAEGTAGAPGESVPSTGDQLQQQIESRYVTRLRNLAGGYESRLSGLVGTAYNEYQADKKQGKKISVMALAGKYIAEGNGLEKQCDSQFYAVLDDFKAELRRNNLPLDTAVRAQQEYEYAKASRKKAILSAAAKMI